MSLLKNLRDNAPEVFLVTLYFLLETVGASLTGSALPVGLVEWGLGLILLAAVSLLVLPVLSRPGIPEPIMPLLVSGVLGAKLWAVTGHRAAILPGRRRETAAIAPRKDWRENGESRCSC